MTQSIDKYEFISSMKYNLYDFDLDKSFESFINSVEVLIRKSPEYKIWTNLHQDIQCQVTGYTKEEFRNEIELHHHPYTLWSITQKVQNDMKNEYQLELNQIPSFLIQNEVIKFHLLDLVPFVPLLKSYHRMYHQSPWEIPTDKIINNDIIELWDKYFEGLITRNMLIEKQLLIKNNTKNNKSNQ